MDLQLKGRTALITGGSKGIGRACAEVLAAEGCALHLAARGETELQRTQEMIAATYGVPVTVHPMDLSLGDNARALAQTCSGIDILVNNAGAIPRGDLGCIEELQWREAWDLAVFNVDGGYTST